MSKFLIIGLGNIGPEYAHTRHNIGFDVLDAFVIKHGGFFKSDRLADVAEVKWKGKTFICVKPTTFMNLSGKAFKYWMDKEKIEIENTLTIVDDLALPISKIRLRASGSDDNVRIAPPKRFSLEESMEYIQKDEYLEITPKSIRMRKIYLDENERTRMAKKED